METTKEVVKSGAVLDLQKTVELVKSMKVGEEITEKYGDYAEFVMGETIRIIVTGFSKFTKDGKSINGVKYVNVEDPENELFSAATQLVKTCESKHESNNKKFNFPLEVTCTGMKKTSNGKMFEFIIKELEVA